MNNSMGQFFIKTSRRCTDIMCICDRWYDSFTLQKQHLITISEFENGSRKVFVGVLFNDKY